MLFLKLTQTLNRYCYSELQYSVCTAALHFIGYYSNISLNAFTRTLSHYRLDPLNRVQRRTKGAEHNITIPYGPVVRRNSRALPSWRSQRRCRCRGQLAAALRSLPRAALRKTRTLPAEASRTCSSTRTSHSSRATDSLLCLVFRVLAYHSYHIIT